VIKFFSSEKYILSSILATWAIIFTLFVVYNTALPFDWSNFFSHLKKQNFLGFAYFNYYKRYKYDRDRAVWWSLVYDMVDCGFTAAAAIIVVKSDRDLTTDSEVKLWISMLWVYMMYTYLPTVFFGDAQDYDQFFMSCLFISNNYFICVIRTLIYQYIVMYRFS
jgi:hypothetical protein